MKQILIGVVMSISIEAVPAWAGMIGDSPDAIVCPFGPTGDRPAGKIVLYVDARTDDGVTYYKPLSQRPVSVTVGSDGAVSAENLKRCDGKTLKELRDAGMVFDLW